MYELEDQVFDAVFNLTDEYRKAICIKNCKEHNVVFILREKLDEGTPLFLEDEPQEGDDEQSFHTFLPIWSHPRFVEFYLEHASDEIKNNYEIVEIKLDVFISHWAKTLIENHIGIAILPLEQDKNFCIEDGNVFTKSEAELNASE